MPALNAQTIDSTIQIRHPLSRMTSHSPRSSLRLSADVRRPKPRVNSLQKGVILGSHNQVILTGGNLGHFVHFVQIEITSRITKDQILSIAAAAPEGRNKAGVPFVDGGLPI